MSKMVTLSIDGKEVTVSDGTLIVDAAREVGINIPVFCYHPKLEQVGMCRMCLVEVGRPLVDRATGEKQLDEKGSPIIKFSPNLETACTTPVLEGMQVITKSEKVKTARVEVLEFLLTSHPLDCPVCDKGGECPLQNLTLAYGPGQSRFVYDDKYHLAKHVPLGELIFLDQERCIQCGRCVRFQDEIVGEPVIRFSSRGRGLKIITNSEPGFDSIFSGNTTDICPVGALTTADFRFGARPWEMCSAASVCNQCAVGCNIVYNIREEARYGGKTVIKRVMPRQNENVNEIWICDKGRFGYHYTEDDNRLKHPYVKVDGELVPADWDTAIDYVTDKFKESGMRLNAIVGGCLSNEGMFSLKKLTDKFEGISYLYTDMAGGDLVSQYGLTPGSNLKELGAGTTFVVVASDLYQEAPLWWLRIKQASQRGATLIVVNPRKTKLDKYAEHVLRYQYGMEVQSILDLIPGNKKDDNNIEAAITEADNLIVLFGSEGIGYDVSLNLSKACAKLLHETGHIGKVNNGLLGVWSKANLQGAWEMGFQPVIDLKEAADKHGILWIAGADPVGDDPANRSLIAKADFVIVNDLFMTDTAKTADVVFPAAANTEYEGTFTSGERIVQRFYTVISPEDGIKPDFEIINLINSRLYAKKEAVSAAQLFSELADSKPSFANIDYQSLSLVADQKPVLSRDDLYFGGTTYENNQGTGCHLTGLAGDTASGSLDDIVVYKPYEAKDGEVVIVPTTRLFDLGEMIGKTPLLAQRIVGPTLWLNPKLAENHGLSNKVSAMLSFNGHDYSVKVVVDPNVPENVGLVPRSAGIPIQSSMSMKIKSE